MVFRIVTSVISGGKKILDYLEGQRSSFYLMKYKLFILEICVE